MQCNNIKHFISFALGVGLIPSKGGGLKFIAIFSSISLNHFVIVHIDGQVWFLPYSHIHNWQGKKHGTTSACKKQWFSMNEKDTHSLYTCSMCIVIVVVVWWITMMKEPMEPLEMKMSEEEWVPTTTMSKSN